MDTNWYVIQVIRGKEEQTASLCRNRIPSTILEECFIPKYKMKKKYEGAWHEITQILFPGYLFMISNHVELLNNELKKIPDFTKLLGNDGHEIYPLRKDEIHLLHYYGNDNHVVDMSYGYIKGDRIIITSGPLKGQEAQIRRIDRHKRLAFIEMTLFERRTLMKVGLEIVEKI